jgi:hypothetical protein
MCLLVYIVNEEVFDDSIWFWFGTALTFFRENRTDRLTKVPGLQGSPHLNQVSFSEFVSKHDRLTGVLPYVTQSHGMGMGQSPSMMFIYDLKLPMMFIYDLKLPEATALKLHNKRGGVHAYEH